jgi:RLL motif-containing protein 1
MSKRKLQALNYPLANAFDLADDSKVRNLVVWLEDQKIRQYKVEDRDALRNTQSPTWKTAFEKYLQDLECPLDSRSTPEVLDWILGLAVRLEYSDAADKYSQASSEGIRIEQSEAPKMVAANPLDQIDFGSPEFIEGVNAIAGKLGISKHPNHLLTLEAIVTFVKTRMCKEAVENPDAVVPKGTPFPFQEKDVGFDKGDYVVNQASKILRLLYIHDLRDLQTKINECIVAVQTVTANPKTDTKLGKVGF